MFHITVLTPEKLVYEGEVYSIIAPGGLGYLEILQNHAALVTTLQPGKLVIVIPDKKRSLYAVSGGILEVMHNEAILLGETIEAADMIDEARAEKAAERARERLESRKEEVEQDRAKKALKRAENRIK